MIKEWNLLRVIACLSIVFLHSTTYTGWTKGSFNLEYYDYFRLLLCFATPTFIILSIIILANRYKSELPSNFFMKRFKFVMLPFISFAIIDALMVNLLSENGIDIISKVLFNLKGGYGGYFILIIFQFYILHYLVLKYKISIEKLFPVTVLIMIVQLYLLYSTDIAIFVNNEDIIRHLFIAWLAYYAVGFLIGKNYDKLHILLKKYKWYTLVGLFFALFLMFLSFEAGNKLVFSRRIDIFVLSTAVTMVILAWGQYVPNFKIINMISNYSLGIYLVHWQVQRVLAPYLGDYFESMTAMIIGMFFISLILSMVIIKLISLLPFGKYIVGNTNRKHRKVANPRIKTFKKLQNSSL